MIRYTAVVLFVMLCIVTLWSKPAYSADVPSLADLKNLSVESYLGLAERKKIEDYVGHWIEQIEKAEKVSDIVKARKALTDGYGAHAQLWQAAYAEAVSGKISVLFDLSDRVKQIQAAMAVAKMPQYTIQPALEKMSRHKNPAVRYWAARGYRPAVRKMLLYPERTKKMLDTLERLGREESGPILAVVMQTLNINTSGGKDAVIQIRPVLDRVWSARRRDLLNGKEGVIDAYRRAVIFFDPADENDKKQIMQMLLDAMESASKGFNKAVSSKNKKADYQSWISLLSGLENKMAELTQKTEKTPVQDILSNPKKSIEQKSAEVRLQAIGEYWKPMLEKLGIKPRPMPAPEKKPVPATAPVN